MTTQTTTPEHIDFDHIRYLNNIPLTVHCLQLELKCDYETANTFAEWHFKHLQHMFSVLLADTRFNEVYKDNVALKKETSDLREKAVSTKKEKPEEQPEIVTAVKKPFWRFWS